MNQRQREFKKINVYDIRLDFGECRHLRQVHRVLKEGFGLPEYYGENWDALWDLLDGRFDGYGQVVIKVRRFSMMPRELMQACSGMLEVFRDVADKWDNVRFDMIS